MTYRWFKKATVQSALVTGVFILLAAIVTGVFTLIKTHRETKNTTNNTLFESKILKKRIWGRVVYKDNKISRNSIIKLVTINSVFTDTLDQTGKFIIDFPDSLIGQKANIVIENENEIIYSEKLIIYPITGLIINAK